MGTGGPGQEGRGGVDWGFGEKDREMSKLNIGWPGARKEEGLGLG